MEELMLIGYTDKGKIHFAQDEGIYFCGRAIPATAFLEEDVVDEVLEHARRKPDEFCSKCVDSFVIEERTITVITGSASILKDEEVEEIAKAVKGKKI